MICLNDKGYNKPCYTGVLKILGSADCCILALITKTGEFRFKLSDIDVIQFDSEGVSDYIIYVKGMAFNVICDANSDEQITADKLYTLWQKHLLIESLKRKSFNERFKMVASLLKEIASNKDSLNEEKDNGRQETEDL